MPGGAPFACLCARTVTSAARLAQPTNSLIARQSMRRRTAAEQRAACLPIQLCSQASRRFACRPTPNLWASWQASSDWLSLPSASETSDGRKQLAPQLSSSGKPSLLERNSLLARSFSMRRRTTSLTNDAEKKRSSSGSRKRLRPLID